MIKLTIWSLAVFDPSPSTNQSTSLKSGSLFLVMVSVRTYVQNKTNRSKINPLFKLVLWLVLGRGSLYDSVLLTIIFTHFALIVGSFPQLGKHDIRLVSRRERGEEGLFFLSGHLDGVWNHQGRLLFGDSYYIFPLQNDLKVKTRHVPSMIPSATPTSLQLRIIFSCEVCFDLGIFEKWGWT